METTSCFWPTFLEYAVWTGITLAGIALYIAACWGLLFCPISAIHENSSRPGLWITTYLLFLVAAGVSIATYIHCF